MTAATKRPKGAELLEYETSDGECREAWVTYDTDEDGDGRPVLIVEIWELYAFNEDGESYAIEVTSQEQDWADAAVDPPERHGRSTLIRADLMGIDL